MVFVGHIIVIYVLEKFTIIIFKTPVTLFHSLVWKILFVIFVFHTVWTVIVAALVDVNSMSLFPIFLTF